MHHPTFAHGYDAVADAARIGLRTPIPSNGPGREAHAAHRPPIVRLSARPYRSAAAKLAYGAGAAGPADAARWPARPTTRRVTAPSLSWSTRCRRLLGALLEAVAGGRGSAPARRGPAGCSAWSGRARTKTQPAWQAAISALYRSSPRSCRGLAPEARPGASHGAARPRATGGDRTRPEAGRYQVLLQHMDMMSRLGLLTSQLLATSGRRPDPRDPVGGAPARAWASSMLLVCAV